MSQVHSLNPSSYPPGRFAPQRSGAHPKAAVHYLAPRHGSAASAESEAEELRRLVSAQENALRDLARQLSLAQGELQELRGRVAGPRAASVAAADDDWCEVTEADLADDDPEGSGPPANPCRAVAGGAEAQTQAGLVAQIGEEVEARDTLVALDECARLARTEAALRTIPDGIDHVLSRPLVQPPPPESPAPERGLPKPWVSEPRMLAAHCVANSLHAGSLPLELEFLDDTVVFTGIEQDVVSGGVFVATYRPFPIGTAVEVVLELSDHQELRFRGVVRWLREGGAARPGMGIGFTELFPDMLGVVAALCTDDRSPLLYE